MNSLLPEPAPDGLTQPHFGVAQKNGSGPRPAWEALVREIGNSLPAMIWICAADGRPTLFNKRWLEFTGCTLESALQGEWIAALHPEDAAARLSAQQAALERREPFESEYRLRRADGEYRWIRDQGTPRFNARGVFHGHVGVAIDITGRKRVEDQLRGLSTAVQQSPVSVVITDLNGAIEYVNPKFTTVTGYSPEEVLGRNPRILKSGETPPEVYRGLWDTIRTGEWRGEFRNRKKNGELYWEAASICPIRDENGKPTHYIAIKEDITARKRMEAALLASEERFRIATHSADLSVYEVDVATGRLHVEGPDPFLSSLRTFDAWVNAIHPDDRERVTEVIRRRRNGEKVDGGEYRMVRPDGAVRHYSHRAAPIREGRSIGAIRDITERKQSEELQARLAALVECSSDAIISLDAHGAIQCWNQAAEKLYGYTAREILGRLAVSLTAPHRRAHAARNIARVVGGAALALFETEHIRKDGTAFPVSITASPIRDSEGRAVGGSVIVRDITVHKQAEQALRESENRFRALIQNSNDLITLMDPAGLILYDSPQVSEMLGIAAEERVGRPIFAWLHPDEHSYVRMLHEELLRTPGARLRAQLRVRHADGSWRWCDSWVANLIEEPGVQALVTTSRDITGLKCAETAVRESEQRYRKLVEDASDSIFTIDLEGNFTSVNTAAEYVSKYSRQELLGLNMAHLAAPEHLAAIRKSLAARLGGETPPPLEVDLITRDGQRVAMEVTARLQFRNGAPVGVFCIARDVSQRKRLERLEHDRSEVLEMVAQNQPLDSVLGRVEEMLEQYYPGAAVHISVSENPAWPGRAAFRRAVPPSYQGHVHLPIRSGDGHVLGRLEIHRPDAWRPTDPEKVLLNSKARLAAIALEHRQLTHRLAHQAHHDPLTGLPNRLLLDDHLHQAMALARRQGKMVAVLYVDLDRFKFINDTLGHHVGDMLLKEASTRMQSAVRASDTLGRTGGDEFVAVLFGIDSQREAELVGERIVETMRAPFHVRGHELFTSTSVGLSLFPRDGEDPATLYKHADVALYEAKNRGRNRSQVFASEMNAASHERLQIESDLHHALDRGELLLHYQPQFELGTGTLSGVEALLRWNRSGIGMVPPGLFVPVAEETGLIIPIGLWVLGEACRQHQLWRRAGHPPISMAVNISATQFMRSNLADKVAEVLATHEMEPRYLELELTEGVLMCDTEDSARQIARLRELGVRISIDDFGTGFSSLSYLQRLPIDDLKIDRCFVQNIHRAAGARSLVQAIVGLAHGLGVTATAEGVETESELEVLRTLGCERAQGFLLGKPTPPECWNFWPPAGSSPRDNS